MRFSIKPQSPGSILQLHPDFTLVADGEALSLVKEYLQNTATEAGFDRPLFLYSWKRAAGFTQTTGNSMSPNRPVFG